MFHTRFANHILLGKRETFVIEFSSDFTHKLVWWQASPIPKPGFFYSGCSSKMSNPHWWRRPMLLMKNILANWIKSEPLCYSETSYSRAWFCQTMKQSLGIDIITQFRTQFSLKPTLRNTHRTVGTVAAWGCTTSTTCTSSVRYHLKKTNNEFPSDDVEKVNHFF